MSRSSQIRPDPPITSVTMSNREVLSGEYMTYSNGDSHQNDDCDPALTPANDAPNQLSSQQGFIETQRRVSIDTESDGSSSRSVGDDYENISITSSIDDELTCRRRLMIILHSQLFYIIIVALVIFDALVVLFEFLLDVGVFGNIACRGSNIKQQGDFCHFDIEYRGMCAPPPHLILQDVFILPSQTLSNLSSCKCGYRYGRTVCVPTTESEGLNPSLVLHSISFMVLTFFMFELLLKSGTFQMSYFLNKFEVFDGIVIVISWTLDLASLIEIEIFESAPTALFILLRLWLILRIINSFTSAAMSRAEKQHKKHKKETKNLIRAYHLLKNQKITFENEAARLHRLLKQTTARRQRQGAIISQSEDLVESESVTDNSDNDYSDQVQVNDSTSGDADPSAVTVV